MDDVTRRDLVALSRRFYSRRADSFDATRQRPWRGWHRLTPLLEGPAAPLRVLDAGCGNGRFGVHLIELGLDRPLDYLGVDSSEELARAARGALGERAREVDAEVEAEVEVEDLLQWVDSGRRADSRFDLVVLFGVLHHVPGRDSRRRLLEGLGRLVETGGLLVCTWWMRHRSPRFESKTVPWSAAPEIDPAQLEPGDYLLSWHGDRELPRYCHFPEDEELEDLRGLAGVSLLDSYFADGPRDRENLYRVYRRP